MISTKKRASAAVCAYVDNVSGDDFNPPKPGETRERLDLRILRYVDAVAGMRGRKPLRLRPAVAFAVAVLLIGSVAVTPVRAGILGAITDLFRMLNGSGTVLYSLDMPGAEHLGTQEGEDYVMALYGVSGTQVALISEHGKDAGQAWVDRHGEPFTVAGLRIPPGVALCYEDEKGFYAVIEDADAYLLVTMEKGDRELFATVLQAIRGSE